MFQLPTLMRLAGEALSHSDHRQEVISRNIANADTPGYAAQDVTPFETAYAEAEGFTMRQTRAGHLPSASEAPWGDVIAAPDGAAPNGNTVTLEGQMVKAAETRREHDLALTVYRSASTLLRSALGTGG